jgi:hypothetical protein
MAARRVVFARVALALVLARGDGLGAGSMVVLVVITGAALSQTEGGDAHHSDRDRNTHLFQHGDLRA